MKVLISVFQGFVMVMVILFSIGAIEVVSYQTINKPVARAFSESEGQRDWWLDSASINSTLKKASSVSLLIEEHWILRFARPDWLKLHPVGTSQ